MVSMSHVSDNPFVGRWYHFFIDLTETRLLPLGPDGHESMYSWDFLNQYIHYNARPVELVK